MSEIKLVATARTDFGKGAARRTRRAGLIPAVLYGHGGEPLHVSLPGHQTMLALKHANALFSIELDGTSQLTIAKDVQRDPVKNVIEHVDMLIVKKGEKVAVEVPVHVTGESAPGTIHFVELQTIALSAEATDLPEQVEVSIEGLEAGTQVRAGDVTLPEGATLTDNPELIVVTIAVPQVSAEDEAADAEIAAGQAAASAAAQA
ncbi:50S ribosomal protein L25/general stress protein Ctc [Cellulomonas fimi]|uniref:Large ribosomal subunit protein bL25 n=1 Tax=Cellulomonas fimi TaxID=1708 RepID=A0A7Y0M066_CELFI|nr:50S ribosomal protein L25/general stress protein Ctc [Cellulomonas fimi]NMR21428.1 50S ribosomal protein L25/general stress protein Ctc [Cellulomonas fimi]